MLNQTASGLSINPPRSRVISKRKSSSDSNSSQSKASKKRQGRQHLKRDNVVSPLNDFGNTLETSEALSHSLLMPHVNDAAIRRHNIVQKNEAANVLQNRLPNASTPYVSTTLQGNANEMRGNEVQLASTTSASQHALNFVPSFSTFKPLQGQISSTDGRIQTSVVTGLIQKESSTAIVQPTLPLPTVSVSTFPRTEKQLTIGARFVNRDLNTPTSLNSNELQQLLQSNLQANTSLISRNVNNNSNAVKASVPALLRNGLSVTDLLQHYKATQQSNPQLKTGIFMP